MVRISKRKLPPDILSKLFLLFFEVLGNKDEKEEFHEIMNDLFSETEQIMIIKRIAITYLLLKGIDHNVIADVLKVSTGTIWKYAFLISQNKKGMVTSLNDILKIEKVRDFFDDIFYELFARPGKYGTNWKTGWQHKFTRDRKKQTGI